MDAEGLDIVPTPFMPGTLDAAYWGWMGFGIFLMAMMLFTIPQKHHVVAVNVAIAAVIVLRFVTEWAIRGGFEPNPTNVAMTLVICTAINLVLWWRDLRGK